MFLSGCLNAFMSTKIDSTKAISKEKQGVYNDTAYLASFPYSFDSRLDVQNYKVMGANRFSEWKDGDTPYAITPDVKQASDVVAKVRRNHVKTSMTHG